MENKNLNSFFQKIPESDSISASNIINYLVFYCETNSIDATPKAIEGMFAELKLKPYSNISAYLSKNTNGRAPAFLKDKNGIYQLSRSEFMRISEVLDCDLEVTATNNLIDLSIFNYSPYYIKANVNQMSLCYDNYLYDATLVLMRKLFETLIIECFERYGCETEIKDSNNTFLYFSDLIDKFINSKKWNVSRNFISSIKNVKKYGDLSAHNRRFLAKRKDIDDFKFELRQCAEEILLTIDYQNWVK